MVMKIQKQRGQRFVRIVREMGHGGYMIARRCVRRVTERAILKAGRDEGIGAGMFHMWEEDHARRSDRRRKSNGDMQSVF